MKTIQYINEPHFDSNSTFPINSQAMSIMAGCLWWRVCRRTVTVLGEGECLRLSSPIDRLISPIVTMTTSLRPHQNPLGFTQSTFCLNYQQYIPDVMSIGRLF